MVIIYDLFYFKKNSIEYGLKVEKLLYVMKKMYLENVWK